MEFIMRCPVSGDVRKRVSRFAGTGAATAVPNGLHRMYGWRAMLSSVASATRRATPCAAGEESLGLRPGTRVNSPHGETQTRPCVAGSRALQARDRLAHPGAGPHRIRPG